MIPFLHRRTLAGVAALTLFAVALTGCSSYEAKAVIGGPTASVAVGELVKLSSAGSTPGTRKWTLDECCRSMQLDGDAVALYATKPGEHVVKLHVMTVHGGRLYEADGTYTLKVHDGPAPGPTPGPNVPDGRYGLASYAKAQAEAMVPSSSARAGQAQRAASAFKAVASQIAAGTLQSTIEISEATFSQLDHQLGGDRSAWDGCLQTLFERIRTTFTTNSSPAEIAVGWREIAQGLEAVR